MSKLGRYNLNEIYVGNGLELTKDIPNNSVDAIISDPPFKISQNYTANVDADNLLAVSSIWPIASQWFRVAKPGSYAGIYYDTRILPVVLYAMGDAGWKYMRGLTFYRRWGNAHKLYGWMSTSDFILLFRKPSDETYTFYSDDWRHDVYIKDSPEAVDTQHKAQKPISDIKHLIKHLCPENGIVLDSYIGSGTTGLASLLTGRQYLGFEISKVIAEDARERIKGFQPMFALQEEGSPTQRADDGANSPAEISAVSQSWLFINEDGSQEPPRN